MSSLETRKIEPQSSTTVTLGEAGDTVAVPTGAVVKTNTVKDSGGNTLFTSDGAGTLSSVNSAFAGAMVYLNSGGGTGITSIEFTTLSDDYDEYYFHMVNFAPAVTEMFEVNFSVDGGANYNVNKTTSSPRAYHYENNSSAGSSYWTAGDVQNSTADILLGEHTGADADESMSGHLTLYSPGNNVYMKMYIFRTQNCVDAGNPVSTDMMGAGYLNINTPIDAIKFTLQGGGVWDGTVHMYGIS